MHQVSDSVSLFSISPSTVKECVDNLNQEAEKEKMVSSLWGAERCLRVLESVSATQSIEQRTFVVRSTLRLNYIFWKTFVTDERRC